MIDIPKTYSPIITSRSTSTSGINLHPTNKDKNNEFIERRLSPTRRRAGDKNQTIERRVSSDRRRPSFSSKA